MQASSDDPDVTRDVGNQNKPGEEIHLHSPGYFSPAATHKRSRFNSRSMLHYILAAATGIFLLTGFGITHPEIITPATGGLLNDAVSFQIHLLMWGPFLVILVLHFFVSASGQERP